MDKCAFSSVFRGEACAVGDRERTVPLKVIGHSLKLRISDLPPVRSLPSSVESKPVSSAGIVCVQGFSLSLSEPFFVFFSLAWDWSEHVDPLGNDENGERRDIERDMDWSILL